VVAYAVLMLVLLSVAVVVMVPMTILTAIDEAAWRRDVEPRRLADKPARRRREALARMFAEPPYTEPPAPVH
jgi:hypothetical protein